MFLDILIRVVLLSVGVDVCNGARPVSSPRPKATPLMCPVKRGPVHRALIWSQSLAIVPLLTGETNNAQESDR